MKYFSPIKNKDVELPNWDDVPLYTSDALQKMYGVLPLMDCHLLMIIFPIPWKNSMYLKKPHRYYSHILTHGAAGSLFTYLKEKGTIFNIFHSYYIGWLVNLNVSITPLKNWILFEIDVEMTTEGESKMNFIYSFFIRTYR